jgi:elongation factor G
MAEGKEYMTENIRNVAVLGHGGSGKTMLVDALSFVGGTARRKGNVAEGHALTMTSPEEIQHGISMQLTPAFTEWKRTKINLIDTPGYLDFTGEAMAAVRVADAAVIVVSATSGVEVGTERVWRYCEERGIPRIFFVSMMDKDHADFRGVFENIKENLADGALPVEIPVGEGPDFRGIINLFSGHTHMYRDGSATGEYDEDEVPAELADLFEEWTTELHETLATTDEELLDRYLEGEEITRLEALEAMAIAMGRDEVVPVFCGSSTRSHGIRALLRKMVELFPSPSESGIQAASRPGIDQEVELIANDEGSFAALVFKTATEPHVGELSYFRVFSGVAVSGMEAYNAGRGLSEKLNHVAIPLGRERLEVPRLHAGDIGVVAKLKGTATNDTLSSPGRPLTLEKIEFPQPDVSVAMRGVTRADEDKIGEALQKLHDEDPTFHAAFNPELGQTIARGLGELHLDVQMQRMKRKYNVTVETEQPRIAYRETITRTAAGRGRFKKQTGGRGQFGDCWVRLTPRARGEGYEFVDSIKGGVIPGKYVPSVNKGIQEAAAKGVLAGFPLVDFGAECYDGSYHSVDSSDIAFKVAGLLAFREVAAKAGPVLLEPIIEVEVSTPDEYMGDIMGDITQRRGKVQGMVPGNGSTTVQALVPEAELYKYATSLRSMTQGRAHHTRALSSYEPMPAHEAERVIEALKAEE